MRWTIRSVSLGLMSATALVLSLLGPAAAGTATVALVSVSSTGAQGTQGSGNPAASADGSVVAFTTTSALAPGDTNGKGDVYVRDVAGGSTQLVSVSTGGALGDAGSGFPSVSGDGRFVAFQSAATTLVSTPAVPPGRTLVYLRDRVAGTTVLVSRASDGSTPNADAVHPAVSRDGRYVAYSSGAANLVTADTNGVADVFVWDRLAGSTERVSVATGGGQGNGRSVAPALSADGGTVAFVSAATNLVVGDTNGRFDVFVRDRIAGVTTRVNVSTAGAQADGDSVDAGEWGVLSLGDDASLVAFTSNATNLVAGDTNGTTDVFVRDRVAGSTTRASLTAAGGQSTGFSFMPALSGDGRYLAFESSDQGMVANPNGPYNVVRRNLATGVTDFVSAPYQAGLGGAGYSMDPAVSADGSVVTFESTAANLVPGDANGTEDVFRWVQAPADTTPPAVSCAAPDADWHGGDVAIACTAADSGSGLANPADASFTLTTSVPAGVETAAAATGTRSVCDAAGNCTTAGPIGGIRVDRLAPTVTMTAPLGTYLLHATVTAGYGCTDGGSGVANCQGGVPNGATVPTGAVGTFTFPVTGTDAVGNTTTPLQSTYQVTYQVRLDATSWDAGRLTVRLSLRDAAGANVSSTGIAVAAVALDGVPLSPPAAFTMVNPAYRLRLNAAPGHHTVSVSVAGDPVVHAVSVG